MIKNAIKKVFSSFLENRILSRWFVLTIDIFIIFCSAIASHMITLQIFKVSNKTDDFVFTYYLGITLLLNILFFLLIKTYKGIIRYSTIDEIKRVFLSLLIADVAIFITLNKFIWSPENLSLDYCIRLFLFSLVGSCGFRLIVVYVYRELVQHYGVHPPVPAYIWGVNKENIAISSMLTAEGRFAIKGFVTDDHNSKYLKSTNQQVILINTINDLEKRNIKNILFFSENTLKERAPLVEEMMKNNICIYVINQKHISNLSELSHITHHIRPVQIEDILGRPEIKISMDEISNNLGGKTVLVTGAAGSIGSEIVRQIARFSPKALICVDQAETPLNELNLELDKDFPELKYHSIIGDIRNKQKMTHIFETHRPEIVYHAAAYKHVPMMERHPCEAVVTNVWGTRLLVDLAIDFSVEMFVMVSTDKAVNPTNIMGATKRIAEMYVQSCATDSQKNRANTKFITTRFGNVLGSNGSVIPIFRKQIEKRSPITVTHPDVTRYFMTIAEACRLVLEASVTGKSGYIYVFNMGEPVKIYDLAKRMIEQAGLIHNKDIRIEFSGLRPGEKLYEEVLNAAEICEATSHEKIMMAKVRKLTLSEILPQIETIISCAFREEKNEMVTLMKSIVPEFISNNSEFEAFDNKNKEESYLPLYVKNYLPQGGQQVS